MNNFKQWDGFKGRIWKEEVNTRDFIQHNYAPYEGNQDFLEGPTEATEKLWVCTFKTAERGACKRRRSGYGYGNRILTDFPWAGLYQ